MHMKRKLLIILGIVFVIVVALIVSAVILSMEDDEADGYDQAAEGLRVDFNADIMVYGEDAGLRDTVTYRTIDEVSEETLKSGDEHTYKAIILYDYKGTMEISDEELLLIKEYVEEKAYDMFYIGKNYLDDFKRLGFTVGCPEGAYSLEYLGSINEGKKVQQNEYGNLYASHGLWTDKDDAEMKEGSEEIQSFMIMLMYDYAREAAGIPY